MIVFPADFLMWLIALLFGAFCVWYAYRLTVKLAQTASQQVVQAGQGQALELHIGKWFQIASQSPAVAFFILGVCGGLALPAFYSWLYSPEGPKGTPILTARGQFDPSVANACFQTDQVLSDASGYSVKIPRQVPSITYTVQTPSMSAATLFIEQDGSGAKYSIDNGPLKPVAVDHAGILAIGDAIPIVSTAQAASLKSSPPLGAQTASIVQALTRRVTNVLSFLLFRWHARSVYDARRTRAKCRADGLVAHCDRTGRGRNGLRDANERRQWQYGQRKPRWTRRHERWGHVHVLRSRCRTICPLGEYCGNDRLAGYGRRA